MQSALPLHHTPRVSVAALATLAVVVATLTAAIAMWAALPVAGAGGGATVVPAKHAHSMSGMDMSGMKMPMR